jgi:flagellar biosynthesis/type III secretory pathway protein FliH
VTAEPIESIAFEQLEGVPATGRDRGIDPFARARAAIEEDRRSAVAEGRAQGLAEGRAEAVGALQPALDALAAALQGFEAAVEEQCAISERRAVELAVVLAEKIVGDALAIRPDLVLSVVAGALRAAAERDHLVVEVNPGDVELVRASAEELSTRVGGVRRLEVVPERRVPHGGCVVRTAEGEIDGRPAEKLLLVRELLEDVLGGPRDA